jgi:RNA polymerase sigma-70 factor (ECF subfamily)
MCRDRELACECADEAFARALMRWNRLSMRGSPDGWIYTVALNYLRRLRRRQAIEARLLAGARSEAPLDPEFAGVWSAVALLPRRQREAIVLRYVADLPEKDIAHAMRVSRGTVSSTLADARRQLATLLEEPAPAEEAKE